MRKVKAYNALEFAGFHASQGREPTLEWECPDKKKIVFHEIEFVEKVTSEDGECRP